jgi:hypothetical protein
MTAAYRLWLPHANPGEGGAGDGLARAPGLLSVEECDFLIRQAKVSFTGLARIARLSADFWMKIPIRALNLAHDLGQPCTFFVGPAAACSLPHG